MKYLNIILSASAIIMSMYAINSVQPKIDKAISDPKLFVQAIEYSPDEIINSLDTARAIMKIKENKEELVGQLGSRPLFMPNIDEGIILQEGKKNYIVIYSDFECPICSSVSPLLDQLKNEDVRIILKNVPLQKHEKGKYAAEQLEMIYSVDKKLNYLSVYEFLFKKQELLIKEPVVFFDQFKKEIGDLKTNNKSLSEASKKLSLYKDEVKASSINSVPSFNINGNIIIGLPTKADWDKYMSALIK